MGACLLATRLLRKYTISFTMQLLCRRSKKAEQVDPVMQQFDFSTVKM